MSEREQFDSWWKTTGRGLCGCSLVPDHSSPLQVIAGRGFGAGFAAGFEAASAQPAITSKTGNALLQGASAITSETVPLLTDEEIQTAWVAHGLDECAAEDFARAIEQAVRAKMGAGVPPPEDWSVFNSGAEVASGLPWAEALEYLTPERVARGWDAVCVADLGNLSGIVGKEDA